MPTSNHSKEILIGNCQTQSHVLCTAFFVTISLDVTISASYNWSVAVFTTSLESQESYLTLRNVTLQARLSITRDFFRQHSTFARLYNAAASPASRLRSAGSLAIISNNLNELVWSNYISELSRMADTWWYEELKPLTALWSEDVELSSIFIILAVTR